MSKIIYSFLFLVLQFPAFAQEAAAPATAQPAGPSFMMQLPMIFLFFALFYFILIAPQRKQQKQQLEFQKSLLRGDEVVTASGIIGKIVGLTDKVITLEISEGTEMRVLRSQIQARLKDLNTAPNATAGAKV